MLKNWKRLLKNFPVNGLSQRIVEEKNQEKITEKSQNNQNNSVKQVILSEIKEIKQEIFKSEEVANDELKMLGDLLRYLRQSRSMSLLMLCRQIKKLEIKGNQVFVHSDDLQISQLVSNEKDKKELDEFFKQRGLSFLVYETKKEVSAVDILKEMLGGKLVIK